jgi:chromosomal replication initiator protein
MLPVSPVANGPARPGYPDNAIEATAAEFGITANQLLSPSRKTKFSHPRILAMALARELTKVSYPVIGRYFSRHHTSVLHAVERSQELLEAYPELAEKRLAVLARLGQSEPT